MAKSDYKIRKKLIVYGVGTNGFNNIIDLKNGNDDTVFNITTDGYFSFRNINNNLFSIGKNNGCISLGVSAGQNLADVGASHNIFIGKESGYSAPGGGSNIHNIFIGYQTGYNTSSSNMGNVIIGESAGYNINGDYNVFIGSNAGYNETGSDKLYISNSSTTTPLIYGEFNNNKLIFNCAVNLAQLQNQPTGTVDLAIATTKYVDDATSVLDLQTVLSIGNSAGTNNIDLNGQTLYLSDVSGDIQSISTSTGNILINSDAYKLIIDTDLGVDVSNGIDLSPTLGTGVIFGSIGSAFVGHISAVPNLTAGRQWLLPNAAGTIALTSDIPPTPNLTTVLGAGNTTSGEDISITDGDVVSFTNSSIYRGVTNYPSLGSNSLIFQTTEGGYLFSSNGTTSGAFSFIDNTGTLMVKGTTPSLVLASGSYTLSLGLVGLTGSKSINFPNAHGTVALTSDIPSGAGLWSQTGNYMYQTGLTDSVGIGLNNPNNLFQVKDLIQFNPTTYSTHLGVDAGRVNTGSYNIFNGFRAGYLNTSGSSNNFIGYQAGRSNSTGSYNIFIGYVAGYLNTSGIFNTFNGAEAGNNNTTGSYNTFIGQKAGNNNTTGSYNTFNGTEAGLLNTTGYGNTFNGYQAGRSNTTGIDNVFNGYQAGESNTTGRRNLSLGYRAGYNNTTGEYNIFIGYRAGYSETNSNKLYIANSSTTTPLIYGEFDNNLLVFNADVEIGDTQAFHFGNKDTDGSWRIIRSGDDLLMQRLEGSPITWTTKQTISA